MKHLLTALATLIVINSYAQEDCRTKISYTGMTLTITNKSCATSYLIKRQNMQDSITCTVQKDSSLSLCLSFCGVLCVLPVTKCDSSCAYVPLTITNNCNPLPIKLSKISVEQAGKELTVHFTVEEITDVKQFVISITTDGKTFKPLAVVLPADVKVGVAYSQKYHL